ncbi:hypothetical protein [Dictyobacter formicarum]|uniref:Uncharacterized protein n=1 Tax=Dictyobacter formicarum TaxID=2778368 RepID=A0ABQ3VTN9_9CHLR|nr:hypothetical protein [Dictyobacter formicarum]GHO88743.1 hypothetical protein KSZ_67490 [Dictyobacter formicarum]
MAKTYTQDATTPSQDDALKKRKKLAKKEAKLMLKVEQAKKDVQKGEQKIHKAQDNLKTRTDRLHDLEDALSQLQTSISARSGKAGKTGKTSKANQVSKISKGGKPEKATQPTAADVIQAIDIGDSYQDNEAVEAFHLSSLEPAEGSSELTDTAATVNNQPGSNQSNGYLSEAHHTPAVSEEKHDSKPEQLESTTSPAVEDVTIQSGEGKMPIETTDEHAWPPPLIREEVAEAIEEEAKNKPSTVESHTQPSASISHEDLNTNKPTDLSDTSPRHQASHRRHTHTSASHQSDEKNQEPLQEKTEDTHHEENNH